MNPNEPISSPSPRDPTYGRSTPYGGSGAYGAYSGTYGAEQPSIWSEFTPARILRVVRKKWLTIALAALLALTFWGYYIYTAEPIYTSAALIEMNVRRPRIMNQQEAVIGETAGRQADEIINTQLQKFGTRAFRAEVRGTLLESLNFDGLDDAVAADIRAGQYTRASFEPQRRTRLVQVRADHFMPEIAAALANAHAETAVRLAMEENRQASDTAVAWLQLQADTQRKALARVDEALINFRITAQYDELQGRLRATEKSMDSLSLSKVALEAERLKRVELLNFLDSVELVPERIGDLPEELPRADEIKPLIGAWMSAIGQRDALLTRFTDRHPEAIASANQVVALRNRLEETLNRARDTAIASIRLLDQQIRSLEEAHEEADAARVALELEIARVTTERLALEREREAQDISYRGILNRIEEARLSADEYTATITLVEPATPPRSPIYPRKIRSLGLFVVSALFVGVGIALLKDYWEDYLINPEEVELLLGRRLTGLIPHSDAGDKNAIALASITEPRGLLAESFASMRSMMDSVMPENAKQIVLVTSSAPGTGKTTTCCNLAITHARSDRKTLLIDFDLRRPRVLSAFGIRSNRNYFADYLDGKPVSLRELPISISVEEVQQALEEDVVPRQDPLVSRSIRALDLIGVTEPPRNTAADLISSKRVADLIDWASSRYEHIIIDSPPLGIVGDATVLASFAHAVVFVARPEVTRKRAMIIGIRQLQDIGTEQIFTVLNDMNFNRSSYYYADAYGYRQYYGKTDNYSLPDRDAETPA